LAVCKEIAEAAKVELANLKAQLKEIEARRIGDETSMLEMKNRFPEAAKEIETTINTHEYSKAMPK
jgi:hypothetical protein